ncbi:YidH family protein [Pseudomonas sp. SP16.1]|uniref:YidH family protein n=1 Tax=Pseudomonas sp. SP16.1 TaxID=3458854 RepID=UPI00404686C1
MTPPPVRKPLAQALLGGEEPDPRFTLANERTFLAWARTALALLGGGIAVETFAGQAFAPWLRLSITLSLLALSLLLSLGACLRWLAVEHALRHRSALPLPVLVPALAIGGGLAALLLLVLFGWHGHG